MNKKIWVRISIISALLVICFILVFITNNNYKPETDEPDEKTYVIRINDDTVCLFENEKIIKKYNIDITVLPGEDIEILLKGINVDDVSEADMLAEDYDG